MLRLRQWISNLVSKVFVEDIKCISCGRDIFDEDKFCARCRLGMVDTSTLPLCKRCHRPVYGDSTYCMVCQENEHYYDVAYSAYTYSDTIKDMIHSIKYMNKTHMLDYFARVLSTKYEDMPTCDIVVSVPPSSDRMKYRFHDHTRILAEKFSLLTSVPYDYAVLERLRDTEPLERMSPKDRAEHLKGAFRVSGRDSIKGKRVLVLDDVYTTGSTANECARVLKKMGALEVYILTIAVTEYKVKTM